MATKKHRPIPPLRQIDKDRFWAKVDVRGADECWPWVGASLRDRYGNKTYGVLGISQVNIHANRLSYYIKYGIDLGDLMCLHTCHFQLCVNPSHLEPGTHDDNMRQMKESGRAASGERSGSRKHPEKHRKGKFHPVNNNPDPRAGNLQYGEDHHNNVFTNSQVLEMRRLSRDGKSLRFLAEMFNSKKQTIWGIVTYKRWRHLP